MSGLGVGEATALYLYFVFDVIPDPQDHDPQNSLRRRSEKNGYCSAMPPCSREDSRAQNPEQRFRIQRYAFPTPMPSPSPMQVECPPPVLMVAPLLTGLAPPTHIRATSGHHSCQPSLKTLQSSQYIQNTLRFPQNESQDHVSLPLQRHLLPLPL